jgi:hypothetical protein
MRAAVRALLDAGNNVILDEMPIDDTIMPAWRSALAGRTPNGSTPIEQHAKPVPIPDR